MSTFREKQLVRIVASPDGWPQENLGTVGIVQKVLDDDDGAAPLYECAWRRDPEQEASLIAKGYTHWLECAEEAELEAADGEPTAADLAMWDHWCDWCGGTGEGSYRKGEPFCSRCNPGGVRIPRSQRSEVAA